MMNRVRLHLKNYIWAFDERNKIFTKHIVATIIEVQTKTIRDVVKD